METAQKTPGVESSVYNIIAVDDDTDVLTALDVRLKQWGYDVRLATGKGELLSHVHAREPDAILLDLHLGEDNGLELLKQLAASGVQCPVVLLTAHGSVSTAVRAIKMGAFDFLTKPPALDQLRTTVERAILYHKHRSRSNLSPDGASSPLLIGDSPAIHRVLDMIEGVASKDARVLITGESGTGKELVARAIHRRSQRADKPFVAVNMASLPETLAESTLFGHEKGAFTGADSTHVGWCESADNGTLFLDEIGEMEVGLQPKLLRFLQEGTYYRVGSSKPQRSDVRIISATHQNCRQLISQGKLREDLYYRLHVVEIPIPPLRERPGDIRLLVDYFLQQATPRYGVSEKEFSESAYDALAQYEWPGNVRELEYVVAQAVILTKQDTIFAEDLPNVVLHSARDVLSEHSRLPEHAPGTSHSPLANDANELTGTVFASGASQGLSKMDLIERDAIIDAMNRCGGRAVSAAEFLGIGQATLYRKLKRYEIPLPRNAMRNDAKKRSSGSPEQSS